ncbi:phosphoribosylaminoimidazolesuccinocarboxamide synthase [Candidatus Woesearchaeota archaeon]|nr:phosphoribosylaminoimidazolesuccinocarboxamide synthase [Candidatus Woesearchaeota archaeon]
MAVMLTESDARILAEKNLDNVLDVISDDAIAKGVEGYSGKVRENYVLPGKKERVLLTSDRVSVFDSVVGTVPFKGQVLDELTHWWFERTSILVPNHVRARPAPTVTVAAQCEPLLVEMVVREYLTGTSSTSIWTAYKKGERVFCGHRLPDGMKKDQRLPYVMVTPSTKAAHGEHDVSVPKDYILAKCILPGTMDEQYSLWEHLNSQSLALFGMGAAISDNIGLILVDTKYEFGITHEGRVVVIDEVHTPDSSRFWEKGDYAERFAQGRDPKSLSKQFVRDAIIALGYDPKVGGKVPKLTPESAVECAVRYIMLCQRITGRPFEPDLRPVEERVYRPLEELGVMRK